MCTVGCFIGGIEPSSAIPSRKLREIAYLIKQRSRDIFGNRWERLRFQCSEDVLKDPRGRAEYQHDFGTDGGGVMKAEYEEGSNMTRGKIIYNAIDPLEVPIPAGHATPGVGLTFKNNNSDDVVAIAGEFCDVPVKRIFEKNGMKLPKLHWSKKIAMQVRHIAPEAPADAPRLTSEVLARHETAGSDLDGLTARSWTETGASAPPSFTPP